MLLNFKASAKLAVGLKCILILLVNLDTRELFCQDSIKAVHFIVEKNSTASLNKNFYYHDIALIGHPVHFLEDTVKIYIDKPVFLLHASELQTPYLVYPGEKIHVRFDKSRNPLFYIPHNKQRTAELSFFSDLVTQTDNLSYAFKTIPFLKKVSSLEGLTASESYIYNRKKYRLELLEKFMSQNPTSADFYEIARHSINSVAFNDSLRFYTHNITYLKETGLLEKKVEEKKRTVSNIRLIYLRYPLEAIKALLPLSMANNNYIMKDLGIDVKYNYILANFSGIYQEYLLFQTIFNDINNYINVPEIAINRFYEQCKTPYYIDMIRSKLNDHKKVLNTGHDAVTNVRSETIELGTVLKRYRNKLIYVDIWASWCAPCREEFKHSKQLQDKLAGKAVEFLYLSIDGKYLDWVNAHKNEDLNDKDSYLLLHPDQTSILRSNEVISIPRYMLIGRGGEIINDNTPRPSDPQLYELILQNL